MKSYPVILAVILACAISSNTFGASVADRIAANTLAVSQESSLKVIKVDHLLDGGSYRIILQGSSGAEYGIVLLNKNRASRVHTNVAPFDLQKQYLLSDASGEKAKLYVSSITAKLAGASVGNSDESTSVLLKALISGLYADDVSWPNRAILDSNH
jgi:hypothetical protein